MTFIAYLLMAFAITCMAGSQWVKQSSHATRLFLLVLAVVCAIASAWALQEVGCIGGGYEYIDLSREECKI